MLNGIYPSPHVDMKFSLQTQDEVNGNNLVNKNLGPEKQDFHQIFNCFFVIQDPRLSTPYLNIHKNFKVELFLNLFQEIHISDWFLRVKIS